jgi:hypothetical protein
MGFPFSEATWNVVDGAMFIGWGSSAPGLYTLLSVVAVVVILYIGNKHEQSHYK